MKNATKKTTKTTTGVDKTKYNDIYTDPVILFSVKNIDGLNGSFWMHETEFKNLVPRLIHEEIIGWSPNKEEGEGRRPIYVKIYVTDGYRTIDKAEKINVAYSYFVRFDERTWKPYNLVRCFEIINGIRLQQIRVVKSDIRSDKRWEEQETKKNAAKN